VFVAELTFEYTNKKVSEEVKENIDFLLGALRMNGQILGREIPVVEKDCSIITFLLLPETDSLNECYANKYVHKWYANLYKLNVKQTLTIHGFESDSRPLCNCEKSNSYILYTDYISIDSPLRCGNCFGLIPLYRISPTYDEEYNDIICWVDDYKACDSLQMNCSTGERFGIFQISNYKSSLTKRGIDICKRVSDCTGLPTYYYLSRYTSYSRKKEVNRKCPSCGGDWLLEKPLHNLFDFKCERCKLLSNISWSVRQY